jgi:hypothetical protein
LESDRQGLRFVYTLDEAYNASLSGAPNWGLHTAKRVDGHPQKAKLSGLRSSYPRIPDPISPMRSPVVADCSHWHTAFCARSQWIYFVVDAFLETFTSGALERAAPICGSGVSSRVDSICHLARGSMIHTDFLTHGFLSTILAKLNDKLVKIMINELDLSEGGRKHGKELRL